MAILTHGGDLSLSPTIRPVVKAMGGTLQAAAEALQLLKFRWVQLDGTLAGTRARDLDQRARKDLVGMFTRKSLSISGLDLFIPSAHFVDPAHVDRAMNAATAGITFAADLGRIPVSIALPVKQMDPELRKLLVEAADGHGIRLAVHAEDQLEELQKWIEEVDLPALGAAIDPATLLTRLEKAHKVASRFGKRLTIARLNDVKIQTGGVDSVDDDDPKIGIGVRTIVGDGDLDLERYRVAVDLAGGRSGPLVLDLRGMENALDAARIGRERWDKATFTV